MPKLILPGPPQSAWRPVKILDRNVVDPPNLREGKCDRCGHRLRFVHVLAHPHWPDELGVGCCCAVRLCDDYDAETAERDAMNQALRRQTFLNPERWKHNYKGNLVRALYRGLRVTIFSPPFDPERYSFSIATRKRGERPTIFSRSFASEAAAMVGAFDALEANS